MHVAREWGFALGLEALLSSSWLIYGSTVEDPEDSPVAVRQVFQAFKSFALHDPFVIKSTSIRPLKTRRFQLEHWNTLPMSTPWSDRKVQQELLAVAVNPS